MPYIGDVVRIAVTLAFALAPGCKYRFDAVHDAAGDGSTSAGDATDSATDAPVDGVPDSALPNPFVQSRFFDTASGNFTINNANGMFQGTAAGHMVLVVCGHISATGPCLPTSTPATTWTQLDGGTSLGVYVACNAPAITSITLQNGADDAMVIVSEWAGITTSNCLDVQRISSPCPGTLPGNWTSQATPVVSQNREVIIATGMASAQNGGISIDAPYQQSYYTGVNSTTSMYIAHQFVDATPTTYTATGTIQQSQPGKACFNDIFAFRAL